jgi:hypothetical protein
MRALDIFEGPGSVPLRDDRCQDALCQLIILPRRMVSLKYRSHRQTVFSNCEATVEDRFQLWGQRPEVSVPERLGVLEAVAGADRLENLHRPRLVDCFERVTRRHEMGRMPKARPRPGLYKVERDDVYPNESNMHSPQILSVLCLDSPPHLMALAVWPRREKGAAV